MKTRLLLIFLSTVILSCGCSRREKSAGDLEKSVITIKIDRNNYNFLQPWTSQLSTVEKTGVVISRKEILTTADEMQDQTMIRVQKHGRGKWWNAELAWIDYHANLAILNVKDDEFWDQTRPVSIARFAPNKGPVSVRRWKEGTLEDWRGEITKLSIKKAQLSFASALTMEITCDLPEAGWSELVMDHDKLVGITSSSAGDRELNAIPCSFFSSILKSHQNGSFHGLGYFGFYWQTTENPANLKFLGQKGEPQGVIITQIQKSCPNAQVFHAKDIILEVDGFPIDVQGDYVDPHYEHLCFENLAICEKWAGTPIHFKIFREGKTQEIVYTLPKVDFDTQLIPEAVFDQEPEYLIAGGLVFQPLNNPYLRSWGVDWMVRAPFRLLYYSFTGEPTPERSRLVILSQVLPDLFNLGYQDFRYLVVDRINGIRISRIQDVEEALTHSSNGFHTIDFMSGKDLQRVVLDASQLQDATQRVLQKYGIQKDHVFQKDTKAKGS